MKELADLSNNRVLIDTFTDRIAASSPSDQTVLAEILLRDLYERSPLEICPILSALTGGKVNQGQILCLIMAPSRSSLTDEQGMALATSVYLYSLYVAVVELTKTQVNVDARDVSRWLRDFLASQDQKKQGLDSLVAVYRKRAMDILGGF